LEKEKYILRFDYDITLPKLQILEFNLLTQIEEKRLDKE